MKKRGEDGDDKRIKEGKRAGNHEGKDRRIRGNKAEDRKRKRIDGEEG